MWMVNSYDYDNINFCVQKFSICSLFALKMTVYQFVSVFQCYNKNNK